MSAPPPVVPTAAARCTPSVVFALKAVLAGQSISELQPPIVPRSAAEAAQQFQHNQQRAPLATSTHRRGSSNGHGSGKLVARGEKVAGFVPEGASTGGFRNSVR